MEQQQLEDILKTPKGLEAITRLLASLHYAPTITEGFFNPKYDPYTTKLRAFVRQVVDAIPESHHAKHSAKHSATYLDGLAEDSGNDLEEILYMVKHLEAEEAIAKLKDLCHHLLTDPDPSEASTAE